MRETNGFVVLQTDFGADNTGTSAMEGVCYSIDPTLRVSSLTHSIEHFNVWQASDSLLYAEPFWPKGTVFVSVVDPGVGTKRRASVAKLKDGNFVVTPDNGTLTHLAEFVGIEAIREIDETVNRLQSTTKTSIFHGRDLFAYCAGKLASGVIDFEGVGPEYPVEEVVKSDRKIRATWKQDVAFGDITSLSRTFGNLFTNISVEDLEAHGYEEGKKYKLAIYDTDEVVFEKEIDYVKSFGMLETGEPLIFNGSTLNLCIACNQDNFIKKYRIDPDKQWKVKLSKIKE